MVFLKKHIDLSFKALIFIALFSLAFIYFVRWTGTSGENYRQIIRSDGMGYYHYYETILGEADLAKQQSNDIFLLETEDGRVVNKYFVGTALLQSPFILSAYALQPNNGGVVNVLAEGFQKAVSLAALFYLLLGLWSLRRLLKLFQLEEKVIAFALFALFFGTNLAYYSLIEPSMSHVYSFALISLFLLLIKYLQAEFRLSSLLGISVVLALIVLVRPVNLMVILAIPFLMGNKEDMIEFFKKLFSRPLYIAMAIVIFIAIIFIQLAMWKVQTGSFIVWSYANEGFYWLAPRIGSFLLSFRKGLFIYTPLVLLTVVLFTMAYRKHKFQLVSGLSFVFLLVYVMSSWWNWYYGDGFGSRPFIDFFAFIALLFAASLQLLKTKMRQIVVLVASVFILFNGLQTYQYYYGIMSKFDMNAEKYLHILGRTNTEYQDQLGGNDDIVSFHKGYLQLLLDEKVGLDDTTGKHWETSLLIDPISQSISFEPINEFGLIYMFTTSDFESFDRAYIEMSNNIICLSEAMEEVFWVVSYVDSAGEIYAYHSFKANEIPLHKSDERTNTYRFNLPLPKNSVDYIQLALWNKGGSSFVIGDIAMKFWGVPN